MIYSYSQNCHYTVIHMTFNMLRKDLFYERKIQKASCCAEKSKALHQ